MTASDDLIVLGAAAHYYRSRDAQKLEELVDFLIFFRKGVVAKQEKYDIECCRLAYGGSTRRVANSLV
jgi:hypothetical protein